MKRFVLAAFFILSVFSTFAQKTYVVSVGIADYKEINDLNLTENDVRVFNQLMAYNGAEITSLLGSQATHANVISTIRGVFAKCKPEDTMIFFFSGHGYEGGFCCWDMSNALSSSEAARSLGPKNLNSANKFFGGLSYAEMQILFRNCRAGKKVVLADACFSGGLRKGNQLNVSVQSARNGDVVFFLSSQTNETSLEMGGGTNGLFTYYLAEGMVGGADLNSDRKISLREIFNYVYNNVNAYASKIPHNQHPVMWGRFDENMTLFYLK